MWCVIPAAGAGTRMGELTQSQPKPLLSLGEETLLERILRDVMPVCDAVCIIVQADDDSIPEAFGDRCAGLELRYAMQSEPLGVGNAVCRASSVVDGPFAVIMGDAYYHEPVAPSLRAWQRSGAPGAILVEPLGEPSGDPMGLVRVEDGRVRDIHKGGDPAGWTHRVSGMFMLPAEAFETCDELEASPTGEIEVEAIVRALLERGIRFDAIPYTGFRLNVNTPRDLERVRQMAGGGSPG